MSISAAAVYEIYPIESEELCQSLGIQRSLTIAEREKIDDSDFAWPDAPDHPKYPIDTQEHLNSAAQLIGRAPEDKQDEIKARAKRIAKRKGLTLPDSWQEDEDGNRLQTPTLTRAATSHEPMIGKHSHSHSHMDGYEHEHEHEHLNDNAHDHMHQHSISRAIANHEPMTGNHTHSHAAHGSQGGDKSHDHEHSNDNNHDHSHDDVEKTGIPDILRSLPSETSIYAPILRIDRAKREVILRATAEALDNHGTVIGFDASKEAFTKWRGNIREMHEARAVGRAIKWEPIEEEKAIDITLRISKGAEDTWLKVLDGTLSGGSLGARNGKWGKREWQGQEVPFLERYDLVEVSLVDNPSCPGCDVKIVRGDFLATDVLDFTEEDTKPDITRAGARVSADTRSSLHSARDHALHGARAAMESCNCAECQSGLSCLDPDRDGDIDILASLDVDGDGAGGNGDGSGIMKFVQAEITRHMSPILTRMNGIAARFAATDTTTQTQLVSDPELTRRMTTLEQKLAELDEVRSLLSEVKDLVARMAAQPMPGGPIVNSAALRNTPAELPYADPLTSDAQTIERLARAGILNKNQQVEAVLYLQRQQAQNGRR